MTGKLESTNPSVIQCGPTARSHRYKCLNILVEAVIKIVHPPLIVWLYYYICNYTFEPRLWMDYFTSDLEHIS